MEGEAAARCQALEAELEESCRQGDPANSASVVIGINRLQVGRHGKHKQGHSAPPKLAAEVLKVWRVGLCGLRQRRLHMSPPPPPPCV